MAGRIAEQVLSNPLIEELRAAGAGAGALMTARVAVLAFPGSCDDRDALRAVGLVGAEPVRVWHADDDLAGADAVIVPGGFSYGDYLRPGALAALSPAMAAVREFAAAGGPVLGICNGFQVLTEAGLLPGDPAPQHAPAVPLRGGGAAGAARVGLAPRSGRGRCARDPGQAPRRLLLRHGRAARRARFRRAGAPALRAQPQRLDRVDRLRDQRRRQRGRAHAPSRARRRPAAGLGRRPHPAPGPDRAGRPSGRRPGSCGPFAMLELPRRSSV